MCNFVSVRKDVNVVEVLRYFVRLESRKAMWSYIEPWIHLPDEQFKEHVHQWSNERKDVCPVFVWTIGLGNNRSFAKVRRWVRTQIEIQELYSCGINRKMESDLDKVKGNLALFAKHFAGDYDEFNSGIESETVETSILITVAHLTKDKSGTLELLDGAHRVMTMIRNGKHSALSFVAELDN